MSDVEVITAARKPTPDELAVLKDVRELSASMRDLSGSTKEVTAEAREWRHMLETAKVGVTSGFLAGLIVAVLVEVLIRRLWRKAESG